MLKLIARIAAAAVVIAGTVVAQVPPIGQPRLPLSQTAPRPIALPIFTLQPRVAQVIPSDGLRARDPLNPQATSINDGEITGLVTIVVENLPPGGRVAVLDPFADAEIRGRLDAVALDSAILCQAGLSSRAVPVPSSQQATPDVHAVDASGVARIPRRTGFRLLPGSVLERDFDGPCQGRLALDVFAANAATPTRHYVRTPSFDLPNQRKRIRVVNTTSVGSIFRFALNAEGASVCSGGLPGLPVGVHAIDGDLALTVRSGPFGTVCRAVSAGIAMPESVVIKSIDWNVTKSAPSGQGSKCCFGDECMERVRDFVVLSPGHLPEDVPARYQGVGPDEVMRRVLRAPAPTLRADEHQTGFAHAWMACDATALTDHSVTLTLRSIEFEVPHDYTLPR